MLVQADAPGAIGEMSGCQQRARRLTLRVGPDLRPVSSLTVPSPAAPGAAIVVGDTTKNKGAGGAGASTTSFFLSANSTYEATDAALGSRGVPALGPGASQAAQTTVTIPAGTRRGNRIT